MIPHCFELPNQVTIPCLMRDGEFLGLGSISVGGIPLRSGRLPMGVEIRSPDAIELSHWRPLSCLQVDGGWDITLTAHAKRGGVMEWMMHTVRNRYAVDDWSTAATPLDDTTLTLELRPAARTLDGRCGVGFSYRWRYKSTSVPIYKILDRSSWEPGGAAEGCTAWNRSAFAPAICSFGGIGSRYTTEWWLPGIHNPDIFQFVPLQTQMSGFTCTAGAGGVLITLAEEVAHIRTYLDKPYRMDECLHLHEHCGDLGLELATSPMTVLWFAGVSGRVDTANLHEAVRQSVSISLHKQAGLRPDFVTSYGIIEEWGLPDLDVYVNKAAPAITAAGLKTCFFPSMFQNNMNTWGVQNMCCTVDLKLSEQMAPQKFKAFVDALHTGGCRAEMWANTSYSTLTTIFDTDRERGFKGKLTPLPREGSVMEVVHKAAQPWVRNPSGAIEADHYAPVFACANLRDPDMVAYWHLRWREAKDAYGLDGIFLDSSFNLSSDKFHWLGHVNGSGGATADQTHLLGNQRPEREPERAILSQFRAHLSLIREMQGYGYAYCTEDIGVFGTHRHGPGMRQRLNSMFMWSECIQPFDHREVTAAGAEPNDVLFQGMAFRTAWTLHYDFANDCLSWSGYSARDQRDQPSALQLSWLHAFDACNADMQGARRILPDESGVEYTGHACRIVWSFRDQDIALEQATAVDVLGGDSCTGTLHAKRHGIYRISG